MSNKVLKLPEVMDRTGLKRASIYAFVKEGDFPKPINLGKRAVGWLDSEVNSWIQSRADQRTSQ